MEKHLTAWRELPDTPWLKDSPRSAQNKAIEDLDRALKNFFEQHAVCPRFPTQRPVRRSLPVTGKESDHARCCDRVHQASEAWWDALSKQRVVLGDLRNVAVSNKGGK